MNGRVHCPPPVSREPLAAMLARHGGARDARGVAVLPGARVYGDGIVLSPDGTTIAEEFSRNFARETDGRHWLQNYEWMRTPTRIAGRTAVVAVNLGGGYSHWLLEELPRWLRLAAADAEQVIAHGRAPFIEDAIARLARPWRLIPVGRHSHFECETAVLPTLVSLDVRLVEELNAFAHARPLPDAVFGEKLYVSRETAKRRRVVNEAELRGALEARGFATLLLEELAWAEQAAAFAAAKVVMAPHGAGLANLVFCRAGTRVVECFENAYVNPCFARLAEVAGLDHRPVFADPDKPVACDPAAGRLDIRVDVARVLKALGEAG